MKTIKRLIASLACCFSFIFSLSSCGSVMSISEHSAEIFIADTIQLVATSSDEDALVLWKTSNKEVATVRRGVVTGKGKGTCLITAYDDNGASVSCKVTVKALIELNRTNIVLDMANLSSYQLIAKVNDGGEIAWSSDDNDIASVDSSGLVTARDIGETDINVSRGNYKISCHVKVKDSSLPEDYYKLEAINEEPKVIANPGVWSYQDQGGGENEFKTPTYMNRSLNVKMSKLTSGDKPLKLRYQPGGEDKSGVRVGDEYTISFTIIMNASGKMYYGINANKNIDLTANVAKSASFSGTAGSSCFAFSIKKITVPSEGLNITISNIQVSKKVAPQGRELALGTMATVIANPGVWYYHGVESDTKVIFSSRPMETAEAKLTVGITALHEETFYFRYQPGGNDGTGITIGDEYNVTFTIKASEGATISYGTNNANGGKQSKTINANTETTVITHTLILNSSEMFSISVPKNTTMPISLEVSNISFSKIS